jgi:excisionase family DNA binding protein
MTVASPSVLTAQDIAEVLRVSRRRIYELMDLKPQYGGIPNFSIGASRRVLKDDFEKWITERFEGSK